MESTFERFSIKKEREIQNNDFLSKVQVRNEKEAKLILAKYDSKHCTLHITTKYFNDWEKILEEYRNYLQKRKEFLELMAEYL